MWESPVVARPAITLPDFPTSAFTLAAVRQIPGSVLCAGSGPNRPYFPTSSFTRRAKLSATNGLVITCMPAMRCPWLRTAFSA